MIKYSELIQDLIFMDLLVDFSFNNDRGTHGKVLDRNYHNYPSGDYYEPIDDPTEAFQFTPLIISYKDKNENLMKIIDDNNVCVFCVDKLRWSKDISKDEYMYIYTDTFTTYTEGVPNYSLEIIIDKSLILETINNVQFIYKIENDNIVYESYKNKNNPGE